MLHWRPAQRDGGGVSSRCVHAEGYRRKRARVYREWGRARLRVRVRGLHVNCKLVRGRACLSEGRQGVLVSFPQREVSITLV